MSERIANAGSREVALLWSLSIAVASGWFISIEWTHPYCQHQSDGPGYAAYGVPLPFVQYGGWSSLHYVFMPHVYVLNVLVLTLLGYPLVRNITNRIVRTATARRVYLLGSWGVGAIVVCIQVWFAYPFFHPVGTLPRASFLSYRPVSMTTHVLRYECSPSSFWFGDSP